MKDLMPLWEIESELTILLDSVETCPAEHKAELEAKIVAYATSEIDKIDRINAVLNSLDAVQTNAKTEIERLRERQQSAERNARQLEQSVLRVLRECDGRPLRGKNVTFSVRRTEALIVDDANVVPDEWKRKTLVVDIQKDPLKRALKAGEAVPGVHIEQRESLQRK
jgi:hypothetical protein